MEGNERDALTGCPIPVDSTVFVNDLRRDARFPDRLDLPGYPLELMVAPTFDDQIPG